ncbi:adhesion G-protein coupled receptor G2-like [Micropterus dolomieu]|uniref:adhesion G-protein coupled receptor G2-like n=1 Tax=Micropterus dolomieu TaxID=147949 RepID=UPI001E8CB5F6|nr:adhesion G-protein coupled receptor G2-like [Micropterus dolomieu]
MGGNGVDEYFIKLTAPEENCLNCVKPVRGPDVRLDTEKLKDLNITVTIEAGKPVDATQAAKMMDNMANLAATINVSSAELNVGEGVTGILKRETDPTSIDNVFFAYKSPNDSISIIDNTDTMATFSRSVTVPKEAFEKAFSSNVSVAFAVLMRFTNLAKDAKNSMVLGNEVLAVEMGANITNLTDKININFQNLTYKGIPSCQSWDGQGSRPNWTSDGCLTIQNGENITCQCSHLTFFAILMAPPNETVSSSNLNNLTIITQVGCGLSMFFLGIVFYMHFFQREIKTSDTTWILIHLMSATFLLDFSFLINNYVANLNNTVGCTIMAAFMHYFLLATFTWFAIQAFHLWLQLYMGGKIVIRHYILKVSITAWVLPCVIGIILVIMGKYGEESVYTNDTKEKVSMCWITDRNVHYIVNIAYYAVVFLFTFTTFIIILSWFFCLKRTRTGNISNASRSGKNIVTILGLCCILGITWGFAFFAYGALQIPSYYIFTTLNSFQGFFLFVYYYNTRHSGERNSGKKHHETTTNTLTTSVDSFENPYTEMPAKQ